jgi:tetratricopeptide (TPR) repeat protein
MQILVATLAMVTLAHAQGGSEDARGRAEFAAGRYRAAKAWFEGAVHSAESPGEQLIALTNLGETLLALGENSRAERTLGQAMELSPKSARTCHLLGQVLVLRGCLPRAEQVLRKALVLAESDPVEASSCRSDLATLLLAGRRMREAAQMLEQAVELAPPGQGRARMLTNLGTLYWRFGQKNRSADLLGRALAEMEEAVGARHPDVGRVLEDYSFVLARIGRKTESRAMAERAKELRVKFAWQANSRRDTVDWPDLLRGSADVPSFK